jgi:predicted CoA-substrate-specific enzyme activase
LGIDVGSVSTNLILIDHGGDLYLSPLYLRTQGQPIAVIKQGLALMEERLSSADRICGAATTGSGRSLAGALIGADIVKNEITSHAVAALHEVPEARTVMEIGGQDSKIIILKNGIVVDFAMNTVCAAGTGSFLDQQANRLNLSIEDFGDIALQSENPVRIAGRCTVFAESDMIHKQQMGHPLADIVAGLCEALVRNYLNNIGKGMEIKPPVVFQDTGTNPDSYDLIVTGDLGSVGHDLLVQLLKRRGCNPGDKLQDCGLLIYDIERQDMHAGGSGCGCSAVVFTGYFLQKLREKQYQNLLFVATGALMSPISCQQGESIPAIAHAIVVSSA